MKPTSLFSLITINAMLRSTRNSRILTTPWSDIHLPVHSCSRLGSNLIETQLSTAFPLASFFSFQDRCGLELKHCSPVMTIYTPFNGF
ncbi:mCG1042829 [Mus musculus]|nr:mCG1042829 [Mus musculus]